MRLEDIDRIYSHKFSYSQKIILLPFTSICDNKEWKLYSKLQSPNTPNPQPITQFKLFNTTTHRYIFKNLIFKTCMIKQFTSYLVKRRVQLEKMSFCFLYDFTFLTAASCYGRSFIIFIKKIVLLCYIFICQERRGQKTVEIEIVNNSNHTYVINLNGFTLLCKFLRLHAELSVVL